MCGTAPTICPCITFFAQAAHAGALPFTLPPDDDDDDGDDDDDDNGDYDGDDDDLDDW